MHLLLFSQSDDDQQLSAGKVVRFLLLLLTLVLVGLLLYRTVFFADETEFVYVTQFGQPIQLYSQPGLNVKWPYQSLMRFDKRLHVYEPPAREMLTADKENLTFSWFVCWRIAGREFLEQQWQSQSPAGGEPPAAWFAEQQEKYVRQFLQSVGNIQTAENRLEERIQSTLAAEIGHTRLDQLVSLDPSQLQIDQITNRVGQAIRDAAAEQFGIEVVDVRLKRFNYPEAVRPAVFAEIRSERARVAVQYRAEGASQKARIESQADLQRDQLLARARRDATTIRGEGEAKAIEIFNTAHGKDPEFYELVKTLDTYRSILDDQTTVVLSADSPLLKLLTKGLPPLESLPPSTTTSTAAPGAGEDR